MASSIVERELVSLAPDGTSYGVPSRAEVQAQYARVAAEAEAHRARGAEIVVVQGLGFVGVAVAAAVAAARLPDGTPRYFVIGVDLARPECYWKVGKLSEGECPVDSPDPELATLIRVAVRQDGNLRAVATDATYGLADVIVVDVAFELRPQSPSALTTGPAPDVRSFEAAIRAIGSNMQAGSLVLIESTVPAGATERLILPVLEEERTRRGIATPLLLAHAYERVMPGPRYVASVRSFWRVFSGVNAESADRARSFLASFIDTETYPLRQLSNPTSSELAKLLENSYRAANIAFIHEWTLLAEQIGVNLFEVVDAIRVRAGTHDNIRQPGFGVGGYCLTKDSLLAQWSASQLFGTDVMLRVSLEALRINHHMPEHTLELLEELLDGRLAGRRIAICGIVYLPGVADTRNSPAELLLDRLLHAGSEVRIHDPCASSWPERPAMKVHSELRNVVAGVDGIVLAVPHRSYLELTPTALTELVTIPSTLVDAQNIITDQHAAELRSAGWRLAGVGKGHWRQRGYQCPG